MSKKERQQRRLQRHYAKRQLQDDRRAREIDRIEAQLVQRHAVWEPDMDRSRVPPLSELEFAEKVQPVVIVGLPGSWYLAKRIIGVYLILLAITVAVAIVFAVVVASCGIVLSG